MGAYLNRVETFIQPAEQVEDIPALSWLGSVPALRGLPRTELRRLAEAVRIRWHEDGVDLKRGETFTAADPLRFVIHGTILRTPHLLRDEAGARTAGPGSVVGLSALDAWARARGQAAAWPTVDRARHDLRCHGRVWTFELDAGRFDEVLGAAGSARVLGRLLGLVPADVHADAMVAALRQTPELRRAAVTELYRAVETATAVQLEAGGERPVSAASGEIHFVVAGDLEVAGAAGVQTLVPGESEPMTASGARILRSHGGATVVALEADALRRAARNIPGQARTVSRLNDSADVEISVVMSDAGVTAVDAGKASERLALALGADGDQVQHLRVQWAAEGHAGAGPFRAPTVLQLDRDGSLRAALASALDRHARRWGLFADHLVVDVSDVVSSDDDRAQVWRAVADLEARARLSYLVALPQDWHRIPERLGYLPPVEVIPTAVLGARPPARPDRRKRPEDGGAERVGRWLARRFIAAGEQTERPSEPWPLDAVRILPGSAKGDDRWARAMSGRRVGLAIGGAGVQSFIGIALIRRLREAGVPIDQLAGTSVGAFISVLYAGDEDRGLTRLENRWRSMVRTVWAGMLDNRWMHRWLTDITGGTRLEELPIPAVVVSTEAADLHTHLHTHGRSDDACLASGSMSPLAPTYQGGQRLVDGAVTANVPAAVLRASGSNLVIGVQPVPPVSPDPGFIGKPDTGLGQALQAANPLMRYWDLARSFLAFARRGAEHGAPHADVVFRGSIQRTLAVAFWQGKRIVDHATTSEELERAVDAAVARWQELRRPAARRVRANSSGELITGPGVDCRADPAARGGISPDAHRVLGGLTRWLRQRPDLRLRVILHVDPAEAMGAPAEMEALASAVGQLGQGRRVRLDHVIDPDAGSKISFRLEASGPCIVR